MDNHPNWLPSLIDREACDKHKVPLGTPCFHVKTVAGKVLPGICNLRARNAGFTGKIDNKSLRKH